MASEILKALGYSPSVKGLEQAYAFLKEYRSNTESGDNRQLGGDYVPDKEDLQFLNNNFEFFDLKIKAELFATRPRTMVNGWAYGELDSGLIAYYNNTHDGDGTTRMVFIKYAGAWLRYIKTKNNQTQIWNIDTTRNIENVIQKIYFEYEKTLGSIFKEVRSSYVDFSYVKFKEALSSAINEWLKTDPLIEGIKAVHVGGDGWTYFNNPPDEYGTYINGQTLAQKTLEKEQQDILESNNFFEHKAKFVEYAPGRRNDIQLSPDLSQVTSTAGTEAGYFTDERQNALARIYFEIVGKQLFKQNYIILSTGTTEQATLGPIRTEYEFAVDASVNRNNGPSPRAFIEDGKGLVGYRIAQDILNNLRLKAAEGIIKLDYADVTDPDAIANVLQNAEEAVRNDEEITGTDIDPSELSDEDIEAKQKFLKQCLLMSRLGFLAELNTMQIQAKTNSIHKKKPYKGRLYLIDEKNIQKDKSSIINKLLIPNRESIGPFLDIKPSEHASLVPKIRLVKVYSSGSALVEHEFKFPKHSNTNRVNNLSSPGVFDRGADFGVKEFSFSFDGTTPATAKNDITANLKLYFQSFQDFVEKKEANGGHRYVDLLILPGGDKGTKKGSGAASPLQFDPSYYRIRADVGWEAESAPNAGIKKAIQKINKTFYLNMVDHEIDIRDDGSVEITVSYRAYIETALKGTTLDALASREVREALTKLRKQYNDVLKSKDCNLQQLTLIRGQFLQIEENLRKNAFQSIIKRLLENNLMNHVQVSGASATSFEKTGYIASPAVFIGDNPTSHGETVAQKSDPKNFSLKQNTFKDIKLSNSGDNKFINYFYLADLLYVILDCLYEPNTGNINESYVSGTENFKFLLSSFQYVSVFDQSQVESVNLGNIPISIELFNEWFTENVIKPERTSYPVMYFIRDLTKFLITEILLESCFKNDLDKRLQFKTTSFLGKKIGGQCPISSILGSDVILDVGTAYDRGDLPLSADIEGTATPVKDLFNYITIFAEATRGKTDKEGIKIDDEKNGIMHYQIGRDRGILKKIKFSKSDMKYIREARFFRHGTDGLMQMSAVYKVSMDMVGNTLYYPGMEVFIDPRGLLGGGTEFDPTKPSSIANKLGFGGYHLVTSVKSSIGPGKFTTSVEALFSYNGDGDPKSRIIGAKEEVTVPSIDKQFINEFPQTTAEKTYCEGISDKLYQQAAAIGYGFQPGYEPIDTTPPPPPMTNRELDEAYGATSTETSTISTAEEVNESLQTSEPDPVDEFGFPLESVDPPPVDE